MPDYINLTILESSYCMFNLLFKIIVTQQYFSCSSSFCHHLLILTLVLVCLVFLPVALNGLGGVLAPKLLHTLLVVGRALRRPGPAMTGGAQSINDIGTLRILLCAHSYRNGMQ